MTAVGVVGALVDQLCSLRHPGRRYWARAGDDGAWLVRRTGGDDDPVLPRVWRPGPPPVDDEAASCLAWRRAAYPEAAPRARRSRTKARR